ncbi:MULTISPECIES: hypothetical protein [unclassified Streptomyces]|uniref:hypothetical protein n=1 Tax=unclassified Streptomyces TaxID=2593676 RepID=UPI00331E498E
MQTVQIGGGGGRVGPCLVCPPRRPHQVRDALRRASALDDSDAWQGLRTAVEGLAAMQAKDHGFSAAFVEQLPQGALVEEKLRQGVAGFQQLIHRAKKSAPP